MENWVSSGNVMVRSAFRVFLIASLLTPSLAGPSKADSEANFSGIPSASVMAFFNVAAVQQPARWVLHTFEPTPTVFKNSASPTRRAALVGTAVTVGGLVASLRSLWAPKTVHAQNPVDAETADHETIVALIEQFEADHAIDGNPANELRSLRIGDTKAESDLMEWLLLKLQNVKGTPEQAEWLGPLQSVLEARLNLSGGTTLLFTTLKDSLSDEVILEGLTQYDRYFERLSKQDKPPSLPSQAVDLLTDALQSENSLIAGEAREILRKAPAAQWQSKIEKAVHLADVRDDRPAVSALRDFLNEQGIPPGPAVETGVSAAFPLEEEITDGTGRTNSQAILAQLGRIRDQMNNDPALLSGLGVPQLHTLMKLWLSNSPEINRAASAILDAWRTDPPLKAAALFYAARYSLDPRISVPLEKGEEMLKAAFSGNYVDAVPARRILSFAAEDPLRTAPLSPMGLRRLVNLQAARSRPGDSTLPTEARLAPGPVVIKRGQTSVTVPIELTAPQGETIASVQFTLVLPNKNYSISSVSAGDQGGSLTWNASKNIVLTLGLNSPSSIITVADVGLIIKSENPGPLDLSLAGVVAANSRGSEVRINSASSFRVLTNAAATGSENLNQAAAQVVGAMLAARVNSPEAIAALLNSLSLPVRLAVLPEVINSSLDPTIRKLVREQLQRDRSSAPKIPPSGPSKAINSPAQDVLAAAA